MSESTDGAGKPAGMGRLVGMMLGLIAALAGPPAASAMQSSGGSAFPKFTGAQVYTVDVPESASYRALEQTLRDASDGTQRRFYAVVIGNAGDGAQATRNYVDSLFDRWSRQGDSGFDPVNSVLIVVAIKNRQVAVRAGTDLQVRYGLRGETIQRDLVEPAFLPLARAGRLPEAIGSLAEAAKIWIDRQDDRIASSRGATETRSAQVRKDADEALATANRLLQEARQEQEEKRLAGLGIEGVEGVIVKAGSVLPPLQKQVDERPRDVLAEAQRTQHDLEQVLGRLRGLPARQNEATARLQVVDRKVQAVEDALDSARKQNLAIGGAQQALQVQLSAREDARAMVSRDPEKAVAQATSLDSALESLLERIRVLPEARQRREQQAGEVGRLAKNLETALTRAERSGASVASIRARYDQLRPQLAAALRPEVEDEQAALATLVALEPQLKTELAQVEASSSKHRLLSRTLPLGMVAGVLTLLGLLGSAFWFLTRQTRGRVDKRYKEVRSRATALMEQLDSLKERHKLLPVSDPDFKSPMEGATLERYATVQTEIKGLWDRWLEVMDRLEKAQRILRRAPMFGVQKVQEAERVLEDTIAIDEIAAEATRLSSEVDSLGTVHEEARQQKERLEDGLKRVDQRVDALVALGVSGAAYEAEGAKIAALDAAARTRLTPDPLTARQEFGQAADRIEELVSRVESARERVATARTIESEAEEVRAAIAKKRAEGLRLDEPTGNPDEPLERAGQKRAAALAALDAGDPNAAAESLAEAAADVVEAKALLERVNEARGYVGEQLVERRREVETLNQVLERTRGDLVELGRGHAGGAWRDVAGAVPSAEAALARLPGRISEAESLGSMKSQRFLAARRVLEEVTSSQQASRGELESVGAKRGELEAIRKDTEAGLADFVDKLAEARRLAEERSSEVGDEAREGIARLAEVQRQVDSAARGPRPDWPEIQRQLARAREGLAIAHERVEADIQAHDKLEAELVRLQPKLKQVGEVLRRENKDRPPSNMRYRSAVDSIQRAQSELRAGSTDWTRLLALLQEASEELARSEELANEDVRLANRAEAELSDAARAIRMARGFSALGVTTDARAAEAQYDQAQQALEGQDYEHAVQLATTAEQTARRSQRNAEQEASRRQYQMESERRRRAAEDSARRSGRLPQPGGLPMDAWVIGAGQVADAIFRGMASGSSGGGFRIDMGGRGGGGSGHGRIGGGGGTSGSSGSSQSTWGGGGGGDTGSSQSNW